MIAAGIAKTSHEIKTFVKCTLLFSESNFDIKYFDVALEKCIQRTQLKKNKKKTPSTIMDECDELDQIGQSMQFLEHYEFIRLHFDEETRQLSFLATRLGYACLGKEFFFSFFSFG